MRPRFSPCTPLTRVFGYVSIRALKFSKSFFF